MRGIMLIVLCVAIAPLLGGCWDRTELNDLAIVVGTAVDMNKEGQVELAVQVFIPRSLGGGGASGIGGGGGGGQKLTVVRSGDGVNMADAMSKLQTKLPRTIFWGHCKTYIFGEEKAKQGIAEEMDFLLRHRQPRERAYMYVSSGKAVDTLELYPPLERYSGEVIRELSDLHSAMIMTMKDLRDMLRGISGAAAVPLIDVLPPKQGREKSQAIPYIVGTAVFKKDKMIGKISDKITRGVMWLRNEVDESIITVEAEQGKEFVSISPVRTRVTLTPNIDDGVWSMLVKVESEGEMIQNGTKLDPMNPKLLAIMQEGLKEDIRSRIESTIRHVQKELKADIFGFAEEFHRKYPKQWEQSQDRWDERFPQVKVKTAIEAYIRRPGLINVPGGVPESEAKSK
ncbi:Ger(x)C family spore germination protein [Paenibacillus mesophilus]|uniref:Ger(x)C family spore germination protein n=1 Tax=Paenibacillus mesophilus TaxID=2582849 RepID=UPI001EE470CE|nr:Ger(x)C family spore germination protein [Paenibacillus mesophilus]